MFNFRIIFLLIVSTVTALPLGAENAPCSGCASDTAASPNLRLLYWNVQNGIWAGQGSDYKEFTDFVKEKNPDICVFCEAASIYKTGTSEYADSADRYLPGAWPELARRYGHEYTYLGGYRDDYPQMITSRYPIRGMKRLIGEEPDSVVAHGAAWAQIDVNGHTVNVVSLHTWPHPFGFRVEGKEPREKSAALNEGDRYRRMEIEYICKNTVGTEPDAKDQLWMMMGDFNSKSPVDNAHYGLPEDTTAFLCQRYVIDHTPYIDLINRRNNGEFVTSTADVGRIDYIYCTEPLYRRVTHAEIIDDSYTHPVRSETVPKFHIPSDHLPIFVDFDMRPKM